jgi:CheY-like chemotaxis protein
MTTVVLIYGEPDSRRSKIRELLEAYGYDVIEAETRETALAAARNHGAIDVLITDIVSSIAEDELSACLMAEQPNIRVLYVTASKKTTSHDAFHTNPFARARLLLALLSLTQAGAAGAGAWGILSAN